MIRDGASVEPLTERQIDLLHDSYVPYQIDESVLSDMVGRETAIENLFNTFRELYRDPGQALDSLWWDLVERTQKVTLPPNRDRPDWASKIHLTSSPVYYQNYVLGELMASQLLSYIQREIVDGGVFEGEEVGNYLVEQIFKPGSKWNWNTMLERATGEPLNPEHFIRQFEIA